MENEAVVMRITVLMLFLAVCFFPGLSLAQPPDAPVVVSAVVEREVKKPLRLVGATFPARKSTISSEVEGVVGKMNAEEGQYVKKGETLAEIKNDKIRFALEQLKNERKEALARAELSEKDFARMKELYDKGIISDGDFDRARTQRESTQAGLLSLESRIEIAEYDLAASRIAAPFNGYVTKHHAEAGQWLGLGDKVVSFVDIDTIEVMAGVPERYVDDISEGMEVEVILPSHNRLTIPAEISSVIPDADPRTVSFPVRVVLENPDHTIKSSASAILMVRIGETEKIKLVPKDSIVRSPQGTMVFVVREGLAHSVPVEEKGWYEGFTHVEGGISVGESVVVRGNERLMSMQKVRITDTIEQ
ncbi:MAG: efflux RND transporter periplasmic adaptor subunit [Candidatus Dadabacteria bacterium]|nr:efflux RND transporter periplasmic adaptor subunit [Candidatus Dadabacteria bacterium]MYE60876.1 efflux RND transporter periplasmic adaptor subunit [Candidatus Dadabacteria bacterium]MYI73664.1 efflux RND transporter periplasmic adaptor subunit [Candidatus Dadabacteria bacterium]